MAAAAHNGETISSVIRRAITTYTMVQAADLASYHTEYRATSKVDLGDGPAVITGIRGDLDAIRQLYPPSKWHIDERDVSPYRASKRRR